ncbi:MAG TPA: nucleotidyl transferase AbiEii/AbiGii toxin family protein [Candidatus Binatia bacterium]
MAPRFARALRTLPSLFKAASASLPTPIRFALIGGLGVSAWGAVRATQDIDLLADSDSSPVRDLEFRDRLQRHLEGKGCVVEWRIGGFDDPVPLLLRLKLHRSAGGMTVDILWAHKRYHREALVRSIPLKVGRFQVPVLHPEDLILMKLEAGGPQDLLDVETLLSNPPPVLSLKSLRQKAAKLRLGEMLDECLRNAKTKKQNRSRKAWR